MADNPFDVSNAPLTIPAAIMQNTFAHWYGPISPDYSDRRYEYRFKRNAERSGQPHVVAVAANGYVQLTPNWQIGDYFWTLALVRQSDNASVSIATGMLRVTPDASSGVDFRPHARIMLEKIESVLQGRADSDVQSYTIGNRQITRMTMKELINWRDYYRAEVAALDKAAGGGRSDRLQVRFV